MIYEFKFPDIGEGVHEGKILELTFQPGDRIKAGDILAVVETDKVVADIQSSREGILQRYGAGEGDTITVGAVLAYLEIEDGTDVSGDIPEEEAGSVVGELDGPDEAVMPVSDEGVTDSVAADEEITVSEGKVLATPVARKLASSHDIDIRTIQGSGSSGRVLKEDILQHVAGREKKEPAAREEERKRPVEGSRHTRVEAFSTLRRTIADNMELSHQIPAFVVQDFTQVDDLAVLRKKLIEKQDRKISFQPFFMKALAVALKQYPILNATFDAEKREVTYYDDVNIGVAVDTDKGLMVPVVPRVQEKTIQEIDDEMRVLIEQAKNQTIAIDKLRGGSITITNFGSFGGVYGRPMLVPPQVAILGFGRMHRAPVVQGDEIVPGLVLPVSMTCDHRVVDGAPAASFLTLFLNLLANVQELLVSI